MEQPSFRLFEASARASGAAIRPAALNPAMRPVYTGLAIGWAVLLIAMPIARLSVDIPLTVAFLLVCGLFVWAGVCLRLRGYDRAATGVEAWALLNLASMTGVLATYVAARIPMPIADHWMLAADDLILPGLDWQTTVIAVAHDPILVRCANWVYGSLHWQGTLLIPLCCLARQSDRCAAFILRWMITLALIVVLFALLPAYGPATDYGLSHAAVPAIRSNAGWCAPPIMNWMRSAGPAHLDLAALDGIVTFPSFHAASATLFAWGFWSIRWARWPMLAINLGMIAASVPIGGHYYIDVVVGTLLAGLAIKLPDWWAKLRTKPAAA